MAATGRLAGTRGVACPPPSTDLSLMPSFPTPVILAALALLAGGLAGRWIGRRVMPPVKGAGSVLLDMVLAGALAARLAFVAQWWASYRESPWSILRLGDGGYTWWAAVPAVLAVGAWAWRRKPALRQPLLVAASVAAFAFAVMMSVRHVLTAPGAPLPAVELLTLERAAVPLQSFRGKPVVLNLWATWCGPCRREMPALASAQAQHPGVHVVLANQGESADEVRDFLRQSGLTLDNVLLDGSSALSMSLTARALPTTAFYDAQGRQVRVHVGELTGAAIDAQLQAMAAHDP